MPRPSKRDTILGAAARVICRDGPLELTLEAVAVEAGVSKGGLLYHFASKDDLGSALVRRLTDRFEEQLAGDGPITDRYAAAMLDPAWRGKDATAALLLALAGPPEVASTLLAGLRDQYQDWTRVLTEDASDAADGWLLRLALDGLWLSDLLNLAPPTQAQRHELVRRLVNPPTSTRDDAPVPAEPPADGT